MMTLRCTEARYLTLRASRGCAFCIAFDVVELAAERLAQVHNRHEGEREADASDGERGSDRALQRLEGLVAEGDGYDRAAHEVRCGGGDRRANVGAELLGGDRDEERPVAGRGAEQKAHAVEEGEARAGHEHIAERQERGAGEVRDDDLTAAPRPLAR